jgi:2-amino-4-hydroxy-6-hydroxymethyldihydropteridine diphosphokinase
VTERHLAYLLLGSNVDKQLNMAAAVRLLAQTLSITAVSSVYETAPASSTNQETFFNAALVADTPLSAVELKSRLAAIERHLGRRRTADKNAPRTIDLDIVLFDNTVGEAAGRPIPDPDLLTHPHVAIPLAEVAPDYVHPVTRHTLKSIAETLDARGVRVRNDVDLRALAGRATTVVMTIGHSTRSGDEFMNLLRVHGVGLVVDVRKIPRSRRNPQFAQDRLAASLRVAGIAYLHVPALGGLRHPRTDSVNLGWTNASFRGYADYMSTAEFEAGLDVLLAHARETPAAVMCAEAVPWRCHRSLIADALVARGIRVEHIMSGVRRTPHTVTPAARVNGTRVTYPSPVETPAG